MTELTDLEPTGNIILFKAEQAISVGDPVVLTNPNADIPIFEDVWRVKRYDSD